MQFLPDCHIFRNQLTVSEVKFTRVSTGIGKQRFGAFTPITIHGTGMNLAHVAIEKISQPPENNSLFSDQDNKIMDVY